MGTPKRTTYNKISTKMLQKMLSCASIFDIKMPRNEKYTSQNKFVCKHNIMITVREKNCVKIERKSINITS